MGNKSVVSLDLEFTRDIKEFKHPSFSFIYNIYTAWNTHNALPFNGSYTNQPNKIIEYFEILDELKHESEMKTRAEHEREMKRSRK